MISRVLKNSWKYCSGLASFGIGTKTPGDAVKGGTLGAGNSPGCQCSPQAFSAERAALPFYNLLIVRMRRKSLHTWPSQLISWLR